MGQDNISLRDMPATGKPGSAFHYTNKLFECVLDRAKLHPQTPCVHTYMQLPFFSCASQQFCGKLYLQCRVTSYIYCLLICMHVHSPGKTLGSTWSRANRVDIVLSIQSMYVCMYVCTHSVFVRLQNCCMSATQQSLRTTPKQFTQHGFDP